MSRSAAILCRAAALAAVVGAGPAAAAAQTYEYRVLHPTYGDIGSYTNIVDQAGDGTEVRSELRIAVRVLGIVVYRQEASRTERWQGDKLASFDGVTVTNGNKLAVHGEAGEGGFAVTTPSGTVVAPANVHPSNPWSAMVLKTNLMMSTKSGKLIPVSVSGGEVKPVALDGKTMMLHQYDVVSDKHQLVWLDDDNLTVAFRTSEDGKPVDFVLTRRQFAEASAPARKR
jgi:hypothetical protein